MANFKIYEKTKGETAKKFGKCGFTICSENSGETLSKADWFNSKEEAINWFKENRKGDILTWKETFQN